MPVLRGKTSLIDYLPTAYRAFRNPRLVLALKKGMSLNSFIDAFPREKIIFDTAARIQIRPGLLFKKRKISKKAAADIKLKLARKLVAGRNDILKKLRPHKKITISWVGPGMEPKTISLWIEGPAAEMITLPKNDLTL